MPWLVFPRYLRATTAPACTRAPCHSCIASEPCTCCILVLGCYRLIQVEVAASPVLHLGAQRSTLASIAELPRTRAARVTERPRVFN